MLIGVAIQTVQKSMMKSLLSLSLFEDINWEEISERRDQMAAVMSLVDQG